jgi:hypothetical protein
MFGIVLKDLDMLEQPYFIKKILKELQLKIILRNQFVLMMTEE